MIKIKPKTLLTFGATGFFIVLILNLFSIIILRQPASIAFEEIWWSTWFPNYAVWLSIFIAGIYQSAIK
jgi:hypothetical protein